MNNDIMDHIATALNKYKKLHGHAARPDTLLLTESQGSEVVQWLIDQPRYETTPQMGDAFFAYKFAANATHLRDLFEREQKPVRYLGVKIELIPEHKPLFTSVTNKLPDSTAPVSRLRKAQREQDLFNEMRNSFEGIDLDTERGMDNAISNEEYPTTQEYFNLDDEQHF
jgi:hypothetical protein